ncbi:PIN domain-containing protein [uncultured Nostoc sp.]|uniref:PIN domain-containing protein n=1 Tax=uncultured Nostoc sp. TaxID=340711 RepID=UPI002617BCE9|nr:PIN domain-containing protein [uncultured Nostoc sp.]
MIRRVLVDIDILLNILLDREPFVEDSVKLWELIESEQIEGYVTPTTMASILVHQAGYSPII